MTWPETLGCGNAPTTLNLGRLLDEQFEAARYEDYVYTSSPQPPLATPDAAWAEGLVREMRE